MLWFKSSVLIKDGFVLNFYDQLDCTRRLRNTSGYLHVGVSIELAWEGNSLNVVASIHGLQVCEE